MRILVANVNTTESMTEAIASSARSVASPGTEIVGITPRFGADSCEGNFESYLAAIAVMDAILAYPEPYDAVIQAGTANTDARDCRNSSRSRSSTSPRPRRRRRCIWVTGSRS